MMSLSVFKAGSASSAITAYAENGELEGKKREDYYTEAGQVGGRLLGNGWSRYDLKQDDYAAQHIQRALDGQDIKTGVVILGGMTNKQGEATRVLGYDLTFSADKSVSVLFAAADDSMKEKIIEAQNKAVERALKYIEDNALTVNVGKAGKVRDTAKLFASAHNHATSRAGDPDLHTHLVLANFVERSDGKIMSLNGRDIFNHQLEFGAIYRAELAQGLKYIGFDIEKHGKKSELMRVVGGDKEIERHYSKRRVEIESHADEIQAAMGKYGISKAKASEFVALKRGTTRKPSILKT